MKRSALLTGAIGISLCGSLAQGEITLYCGRE